MILLEATLMEASFQLKDVIYLLIFVGGLVGGWYKIVNVTNKLTDQLKIQAQTIKELKTETKEYRNKNDEKVDEMREKQNKFQEQLLEVLSEVRLSMAQLKAEIKDDLASLRIDLQSKKD